MKLKPLFRSGLALLSLLSCLGPQIASATVNIVVQPGSQVVLAGSNAVITADVTVTAGEVITGYSWQMSTNGLNPFLTVGSGSSLSLTNVQPSAAGFYFVRVSYLTGAVPGNVASTAVTLTVQDAARITSQPQGLIRPTGTNVSFTVTALGLPAPAYQWRFNGTNLANGGRLSGANAASLTITGLLTTDSGNYDVVVTNLYSSPTSQVAVLSVLIPPAINVGPQNTLVVSGSNATFGATVNGSALAFRWRKGGANLSNGGRISGATNNSLTITGALTNDNGNYSLFISNAVGSATSADAALTVFIPPTFTSATNATGRQGALFNYTATATGTPPITFDATGLPAGLTVTTNGLISGIPAVSGVFAVTLFAIDPVITNSQPLFIALATGYPGITSALTASGQQGQLFSYAILASNNPVTFSASGLPAGVNLNPATGVIAGYPVASGSFTILIGATNQYGQDAKTLTVNLASALPVITSPLTASGTENQSNFSYTITANNSPVLFEASGLPLGLTINTNTGAITGTPLYGGTFNVLLRASNFYGTSTATLVLTLDYATVNGLAITAITNVYSAPYLLDFSFSLRDNEDPTLGNPVVRPVSQFQVVCMEAGVPIPGETALIVDRGNKKQVKMYLALDYTYSMLAAPGAIDAMQDAAKTLINTEPAHAQFGIYEFHADYVDPQLVTTNGLTANKAALAGLIDGIQANNVQGNYAGTRCWDAIYAALGKFGPFTATNRDEQRYLVVMSDGNDASSLLNTNIDPIATMVALAQTNQVKIYCVAFGPNINTNNLQQLTSQTLGQYYEAATTADLRLQFMKIAKDIDGQYLVRWATLRRAPLPFQPSFQITLDGFTASFNTNLIYGTNIVIDTNAIPATTNITVTNIIVLPYNPATYAGNVKVGALQLVADSEVGPQTIRLRTSYAPRFVREVRVIYRPNFPCVANMSSSGPGEILNGWSMIETNDPTGLRTLRLVSPNPNNLLTSIPYGAIGELLTFNFQHPELVTGAQAFSVFTVDNTIYTNMLPNGQSFVLQNGTNFTTSYPSAPPHGTPIPWLIAYGFTNNFAAAELGDPNGNGLAVWQDYLAGLNPVDPNSKFSVQMVGTPPLAQPQITFSTVIGRTYRLESATSLDSWTVLRDNFSGTGGNISFTDLRNLSGVNTLYYRVAVY